MKVGLVCFHTFSQPGGVKKHVLGLYNEYKKRGIKVKIIVPRRSKEENYGKDVILLGTSLPLTFSGSQSDLDINFNPLAIGEVLKKEKFDVLHFHNFGFPSIFQILRKSKALNILTFHGNIRGSKFLKYFPVLLEGIKEIVKWKVDGVIGVASFNLDIFKDLKRPKIVIPNGIDLKEFNPQVKKIKKFLDGKINILFLGRIEERKGLAYLLRACKILEKKVKNFRLIVVGEGPLKADLKNWAIKNNLQNVAFEEKTVVRDASSYFNTCDIYCTPAIFGESFGIVILEGMACGKPVVAFDNEGYKELLTGKRGGILVKNRSYKELANVLEKLIKSKKLRKKIGERALKEVKEYSWEKVADRVLDFYDLCRKEKEKIKFF